ncbi:iron-containing alcohol dehydrogenase [Paenibacillus cremeus]|uniref:iron-containing alcohol dehydrogenase n=1 Tax=Paenibacillus cremeus TaxID=2163881 RepID=UPI001C9585CA|nr:iron-containing alcohol dehydrogenase [Paenibacillus cremeus]
MEQLGKYVLVTMDAPWQLYEPLLRIKPEAVLMVESLNKESLDKMVGNVPRDCAIVGLGGGTALDAAKYFAYSADQVPLLVPSITSSNAPFTDFISIRKNGTSFGFKVDGYPKKILIDYELIQMADPRLNRAGYGDLLYMQTTWNDWKIAQEKGIGPALDPEVEREIDRIVVSSLENAPEIGSLTQDGIRLLMENTQSSSELYMLNPTLPISAGSDHLFAWNLELTTGKPLIHGEIVSLGIVMSSFLQKSYLPESRYRELRKAMDEACVIYHPDQIGVTWDEIVRTLQSVESYNKEVRGFHTVFEWVDWTPSLWKRLKDYLYNGIDS